MDKSSKQNIINQVTRNFSNKQWFNGVGFPDGDKLVVAYNYYPAFELVAIKSYLSQIGVEYELRDIRQVLPGSQKDEVPSYIR
jgi:hypothetical protein